MLAVEQRGEILSIAVREWSNEGWLLQTREQTWAQMRKPAAKKSGCLLVILLLAGVLPGILYAMWPVKPQLVTLAVDTSGELHVEYARG